LVSIAQQCITLVEQLLRLPCPQEECHFSFNLKTIKIRLGLGYPAQTAQGIIEEPRSKLRRFFDRKEFCLI